MPFVNPVQHKLASLAYCHIFDVMRRVILVVVSKNWNQVRLWLNQEDFGALAVFHQELVQWIIDDAIVCAHLDDKDASLRREKRGHRRLEGGARRETCRRADPTKFPTTTI